MRHGILRERIPMHELFARQDVWAVPKIPMPFYVRSVGHKILAPGYREEAPEIRHPFFEMIWSVHGSGFVYLFEQKFTLRENDVFFYHPGERHRIETDSHAWEYRWLTFDGPSAAAFFDGYRYGRFLRSSAVCPVDLFRALEAQIADSSPHAVRSLPAILCRILADAGGVAPEREKADPVEEALNLIRRNLANPDLNVNFLADQLGMHRSSLSRLFRMKLNRHPNGMIRSMRAEHAKELIVESDLSFSEISIRCGMTRPGAFSRFIRDLTGKSPSLLRESPDK